MTSSHVYTVVTTYITNTILADNISNTIYNSILEVLDDPLAYLHVDSTTCDPEVLQTVATIIVTHSPFPLYYEPEVAIEVPVTVILAVLQAVAQDYQVIQDLPWVQTLLSNITKYYHTSTDRITGVTVAECSDFISLDISTGSGKTANFYTSIPRSNKVICRWLQEELIQELIFRSAS